MIFGEDVGKIGGVNHDNTSKIYLFDEEFFETKKVIYISYQILEL